jgi:hypothetical protein
MHRSGAGRWVHKLSRRNQTNNAYACLCVLSAGKKRLRHRIDWVSVIERGQAVALGCMGVLHGCLQAGECLCGVLWMILEGGGRAIFMV